MRGVGGVGVGGCCSSVGKIREGDREELWLTNAEERDLATACR